MKRVVAIAAGFIGALLVTLGIARAHEEEGTRHPPDSTESAHRHAGPMPRHAEHGARAMVGLYGSYAISREASGTAWQPDLAAHDGVHAMRGSWMFLLHGFATGVYDDQGGSRGDEDFYGASMLMGIVRRDAGRGTLGLRAMLSADPATIGKEGYPPLLQTGETADGVRPLIDRQHPHDLFMELAATFSVAKHDRSAFLYLGMPGEPALGPPAFMHRFSGVSTPLAPISHHWLDSTHITYGVATLGLVKGRAKLEGSVFTGREPDENRVGWDSARMDSHAFRVSLNPRPEWSAQISFAHLESPEQLHPEEDTDRTTASVMYNRRRTSGESQLTLAWGRNRNEPGRTTDMLLAEGAATIGARSIVFARAERGEKSELFDEDDPRADDVFTISQLSGGYVYDVVRSSHASAGLGFSVGVSFVPNELESEYGDAPTAGTVFVRVLME